MLGVFSEQFALGGIQAVQDTALIFWWGLVRFGAGCGVSPSHAGDNWTWLFLLLKAMIEVRSSCSGPLLLENLQELRADGFSAPLFQYLLSVLKNSPCI